MTQTPEAATPDDDSPPLSWRTVFRWMLAAYLVTLPACTQDAGHFGPGFFPLLAALLLVPLFALLSLSEAVVAWQNTLATRQQWPAALGISLVAAGYCGIIAWAVMEKMH